ncbi:hypothetical protein ASH00_04780 [Arthrobacter sp. Soil782]|nr:hypothetical protein ASH00_04780 [Arthrobacter sp. Soil782]
MLNQFSKPSDGDHGAARLSEMAVVLADNRITRSHQVIKVQQGSQIDEGAEDTCNWQPVDG